jgi:hypothetical protein
MTSSSSLDELDRMGWTLDPSRGIQRTDLTSLALVLRVDGMRQAQVSGIALTHDEVLAQAVAEANRWLRINGVPGPLGPRTG